MPGISGLDVLEQMNERGVPDAHGHDHRLRLDRDGGRRHQAGRLRFSAKAVHARRTARAVRRDGKHLLVQRQARQLAEEKRQVRFEFISVLGHELKAPLAAVEGYLQMLKDGTAGDDPAVLQQIIDRGLARSAACASSSPNCWT